MIKVISRGLFILIILILITCIRTTDTVICTDEHVRITLTVIEEGGIISDSVQIRVYNKRTNAVYDLTDMNDPVNQLTRHGSYTIFHDGFLNQVRGKVERLVVEGEKGNLGFNAELEVGGDDCHVYKVSGPDTVTLDIRLK